MTGAENAVRLRVASLPDFIIMKADALAGRDKPKDAYVFATASHTSPADGEHWQTHGGTAPKKAKWDVV